MPGKPGTKFSIILLNIGMKNTRSAKRTNAMDSKGEVQQSNDPHITQDFEGYPNGPAKDSTIKPKTKAEKLTAQTAKAASGAKKNPAKKKSAKPGDTTNVEQQLAHNSNTGKTGVIPNKVERIKKQKK